MKIDRHVLGWIIVIDVLYLTSFILPVYRWGGLHLGWEVFLAYLPTFGNSSDTEALWDNLTIWTPNPLLWVGVICLWGRRPHLALAAGGLAVALSGRVLFLAEYFFLTDVAAGDAIRVLWERSGAYVWFASMLILAVAGVVFTIKQWRETRRLPMMGER